MKSSGLRATFLQNKIDYSRKCQKNTIGQVLLVMFGFGYVEVDMDNIAKVFLIVGYGQSSSNVT